MALLLSTTNAVTPLGFFGMPSCALYVGTPFFALPGNADAFGQVIFTIPLPPAPGDLFAQWIHAAPGMPGGLATSEGMQLQIR